MKGVVIKFDATKGFGFIRSAEYEKNVFVHISNVVNAKALQPGQEVEFEIKNTSKGMAAFSVKVGKKPRSPVTLFGVISLVLIVLLSGYLAQTWNFVLAYLLGINVVTVLMYGYDKAIASSNRVRVPEKVLHGLAMLGGSPAALFAQLFFRHKTVKASFQLSYWAIVLVQVVLIVLILEIR
jgi:uncharacterized membrane protein YsdA (DUF1294 family)/cold shock CspA family protein